MKNIFKLTLVVTALFILSGFSANAQKFGYLNYNEIIQAMPELEDVQNKVAALEAELTEEFDVLDVEFNTKMQEYTKNQETWSKAVVDSKMKELQGLSERRQEFAENAQQEIQKEYYELMTPLIERVDAAIRQVSKEQNMAMVFNTTPTRSNELIYYDESQVTDITPLVKAALGI